MDSSLNRVFCSVCRKIEIDDDKFVKLSFAPSEEISFKEKLQFCVSEMVIDDAEVSFLCKPCSAALETAYIFRRTCLKTVNELRKSRSAQPNVNDKLNITNLQRNLVNQLQSLLAESFANLETDSFFNDNVAMSCVGNDEPEEGILSGLLESNHISNTNVEMSSVGSNEPEKIIPSELPVVRAQDTETSSACTQVDESAITKKAKSGKSEINKSIPLSLKDCDNSFDVLKRHPSFECTVHLERLPITNQIELKRLGKPSVKTKRLYEGFQCCVCNIRIYKSYRFIEHILRHLNKYPYTCNQCTMKTHSRDTLIRHYRLSHNSRKNFRNDKDIDKMGEKGRNIVWDYLRTRGLDPQKYSQNIIIKRKKIRKKKGNNWKLKKRSTNTSVLAAQNVIDTVKDTTPLDKISNNGSVCEICNFQTKYKHKFKLHLLRHSGYKPYKCSKCHMRYYEKYLLSRHEVNCKATTKKFIKKKYYCETCKNEFSCKDHQYVHTKEKPYQCEICDRRFRARASLHNHKKIHLKGKIVIKNRIVEKKSNNTHDENCNEEQSIISNEDLNIQDQCIPTSSAVTENYQERPIKSEVLDIQDDPRKDIRLTLKKDKKHMSSWMIST